MPYLSVVSPAYNEEDNIEQFITQTAEALNKNGINGDIIVINDASTDRTGSILKELEHRSSLPKLTVIQNRKRLGITESIQKGYNLASGDVIIFLPSDLESSPGEDIPKLLGKLEQGYDLVMGWRRNKKEGRIKVVSSKIFNLALRVLFGIQIHDAGWVRAFRRDVLKETDSARSDWHRLFAALVASRGYTVTEIPTNFYPRKKGVSKFGKTGFKRAFGALLDLVAVKFIISFSKKPMRIFGAVGFVFFLLGFAGGLYLTYLKITLGSIANRIPLLFLVLLLTITGIQIFAIGFLAEMIANIKEKIK